MKVYFSHGKESGPWGSKIKHLAAIAEEYGFDVQSIDYRDISDPDRRVDHLIEQLKYEPQSFVLVGSSMGGYVSLAASESVNPRAIFLLAPALFMSGYDRQSFNVNFHPIEVVHGWSDDIIPPEHSIRFAKEANCSLHLISGDHRLNSSIKTVSELFKQFLLNLKHSSGV